MAISNPRFEIDGSTATSFIYGRTAELIVDVDDFPGGEIVFKLQKTAPAPPLLTATAVVPAVGPDATSVRVPVRLNYQWQFMEKFATTYSHFNACADAKTSLPYQTNASFLANQITDDLLYPPLFFTASAAGQPTVTSPVIRRAGPQFVPGNKVELLVNGDQIQTGVLTAINGAQNHIHLDWFFFDTKAKVAQALIAAAGRGVEVRLLFDQLATATPEPLGQGIAPGAFVEGMEELAAAGVQIGMSGLMVPPLDNLREVIEPEYRDRLEVQKEYVKNLMLMHGGLIAGRVLQNYNEARLIGRLPRLVYEVYGSVGEWGTNGVGSPVLLGGCRDHTKLIVVDGRIAFCGGPNAQRYYLFDNPIDPTRDATEEMNDPATVEKWSKWHDAFARYEGPAVAGTQRYFAERWAVCTGEYLPFTSMNYFPTVSPAGTASIKVINNVPGLERDIAAEYLRMFRNSTQRIQIDNPYVTDDLLAIFMSHAAQIRHVPVDLIVPEKYLDFAIARDLMKSRWDSLRAAGIALYAYDSHMMHVKIAMADARTTIVSSYNFAKSSAAQLFEHGIVVDDTAFAAEVQSELFDVDRTVSTPVTASGAPDWNGPKIPAMRFADRIV